MAQVERRNIGAALPYGPVKQDLGPTIARSRIHSASLGSLALASIRPGSVDSFRQVPMTPPSSLVITTVAERGTGSSLNGHRLLIWPAAKSSFEVVAPGC